MSALQWQTSSIVEVIAESPSARTLIFDVPKWDGHRAGQHIDLRLTADDGYQATRSYSLSSGPSEGVRITVERVADGEVSTFLVDDAQVGDTFEVRGPIGGYFVWDRTARPIVLIGGGSGLAPLRSIWKTGTDDGAPIVVAASFRDPSRLLFADELNDHGATVHYTRLPAGIEVPGPGPGSRSVAGRITPTSIGEALTAAGRSVDGVLPLVFVCGPTEFVDEAARILRELGHPATDMRLERFG